MSPVRRLVRLRRATPKAPARRQAASAPLAVWKFGGASLADAAAIRKAAERLAAHAGPLVVVCSAMAGVTDQLLEGARLAVEGEDRQAARVVDRLLARHRKVVTSLVPAGRARRALLASLDVAAREYRDLCTAVHVLGHIEPRASDVMVSRGERLSASILAVVLAGLGRKSALVDGVDVIATDGHHGGAAPLLPETTRLARRTL